MNYLNNRAPHIYRNILTEEFFQVSSYAMRPLKEKTHDIYTNKLSFRVYFNSKGIFIEDVYIYVDDNGEIYTDIPYFYNKSLVFNSTQSTLIVFSQLEFLGAVIDGGTVRQQYVYERVMIDN
jgi:hypothetical protein